MVVKEINDAAANVVGGIVSLVANYLWLIAIVIILVLSVFFAGEILGIIREAARLIFQLAGTVI